MNDPFDLERFVSAQDPVFDSVCAELARGRKEGHWMWFVFPQLRGLGQSWMANRYGISSREEAQAYLRHALLGPRLRLCTDLVNRIKSRPAQRIFGPVDAMKFRSSMTLFSEVATDNEVFALALRKYFGGQPDALTLQRL